ncbi:MAG: hypothetical protein ACK5OX_12565 [Desertimonas sp.]
MTGTRRVVVAILATGAVATLSACGVNESTAVTVDGEDISVSDFESLAQAYQADAATTAAATAEPAGAGDTMSGATARGLLGQVIIGRLMESFLVTRDAMPSADELAAAPIEEYQAGLPAGVLGPLQLYALGTGALSTAVTDEEAAEIYDAPAGESGLLCPRLIITETEEEANDLVAELEAGADFAELAGAQTVDESLAATGGILPGQTGGECVATSQLSADAPVGAAGLTLTPGTWSAPVTAQIDAEGTMGWFVMLHRPFEEVSGEVAAAAVGQVVTGFIGELDVEVDPMYGRWDAEQFAVVEL